MITKKIRIELKIDDTKENGDGDEQRHEKSKKSKILEAFNQNKES